MLTLDVLKAMVAAMESRTARIVGCGDNWRELTDEAMREVMQATRGTVNPKEVRAILEHHFKCFL